METDSRLIELILIKHHIDYVQQLIDSLEIDKTKSQIEYNTKLKEYQTNETKIS